MSPCALTQRKIQPLEYAIPPAHCGSSLMLLKAPGIVSVFGISSTSRWAHWLGVKAIKTEVKGKQRGPHPIFFF